jgi:hypothetical protein
MSTRLFGFILVFMQITGFFSCITADNSDVHLQNSKPTFDKESSIPIQLAVGKFDPLLRNADTILAPELIIRNYPKDSAGYYILQFKGPVLEKWKNNAAAAGTLFFDYIPKFAFIVKMDYNAYKSVRAMDSVRWVGIYQPGYRIAPKLLATLSESENQHFDVLVSVFSAENVSTLRTGIKRLGGKILSVSETQDKLTVTIPVSKIVDLAHLNGIKFIEKIPEFKLTPGIKKI